MSQVGKYKGIEWHRKPICEVFPHMNQTERWYFLLENGDYTGDHFRTIGEMKAWIDARPIYQAP